MPLHNQFAPRKPVLHNRKDIYKYFPLFLSSVVFLAGFWTGVFPTTLFADSTLLSMAGLLVTMLLVHLGTTMPPTISGVAAARLVKMDRVMMGITMPVAWALPLSLIHI